MSNYLIQSIFKSCGKYYYYSRIMGSVSSYGEDTFLSGGRLVLLPCFPRVPGGPGEEVNTLKSWPGGHSRRENLLSSRKPSASKIPCCSPRIIKSLIFYKLKPNSAKGLGWGVLLQSSFPWIVTFHRVLDFLWHISLDVLLVPAKGPALSCLLLMSVIPRLIPCFQISLGGFIKIHGFFHLKIKDCIPQSNLESLFLFSFSWTPDPYSDMSTQLFLSETQTQLVPIQIFCVFSLCSGEECHRDILVAQI